MSRTHNTKHDFRKNCGVVTYPNGYDDELPFGVKHFEPGDSDKWDRSYTTGRDNWNVNAHNITVRHPYKKRKRGSLSREFTNTGMMGTRYWRNRFGEIDDRSSRCRLIKREMAQTRRHRLKHDAQDEINRELNEY